MSARAPHRQSEIDRAMKAAAKYGYGVRIEADAIVLLPPSTTPPNVPDQSAAEKALAAWRRSA